MHPPFLHVILVFDIIVMERATRAKQKRISILFICKAVAAQMSEHNSTLHVRYNDKGINFQN